MSEAMSEKASPFRSLHQRNVRVYFVGLLLSNVGTWLQFTATSLLIYQINNRATDAGWNTMFQFLPMLLLGAWAGGFADRHDRRRHIESVELAMKPRRNLCGTKGRLNLKR